MESEVKWWRVPLTKPTGKVRVKTRENLEDFGTPKSARQEILGSSDYIEWQISYDTDKEDESAFKIHLGGGKYSCELSDILWSLFKSRIVSAAELQDLVSYAEDVCHFLEDVKEITRKTVDSVVVNGLELSVLEERYPTYLFRGNGYAVEVVVRHKQKAVGYQPMLYLCVPLSRLRSATSLDQNNLLGRRAFKKEEVLVPVTKEMALFLVKIFAIMSRKHNEDIRRILEALLSLAEGSGRDGC